MSPPHHGGSVAFIVAQALLSFRRQTNSLPHVWKDDTDAGDHQSSVSERRSVMATIARDIMTKDPACCTPKTSLDEVARMMVKNNCGEIPVIDANDRVVGVITDRDIVCRVVAEGRNPI